MAGYKDNGRQHWTWCFRAAPGSLTWFRIDPTRSSEVLLDVLGAEFEGVFGCDYCSAYRKYMRQCDVRSATPLRAAIPDRSHHRLGPRATPTLACARPRS